MSDPAITPEMDAIEPRLSRSAGHGRVAAPVRIVHLGLGNFLRAHEAWYTEHAPDAGEWGIAAFTGRRPDAALALQPQDGLYTLITREPDGDRFETISSLSAVHDVAEHDAFLDYLREPVTAIISLTVTEGGYVRTAGGRLDVNDADVAEDIAGLRAEAEAPMSSTPGRLVAGLLARREAGAGPLTILPCDNLPANGEVAATVVRELANKVDPTLVEWIDEHVDFATTMVDRITPGTTETDRELVREQRGVADAAPVVTEPFSEWVIAGEFPAGKPAWEDVGAQLVEEVGPYEQRKLLLLNGAHSLLAYAGSVLGHSTVDEAITDERCRGWVQQLWDEATASLTLPEAELADYRTALVTRFMNPRMGDALARIAQDGSQKLPARIVPVLRTERSAGRMPQGAVVAVAAWLAHLRGAGAPVKDVHAERWQTMSEGSTALVVAGAIAALVPELEHDNELMDAVVRQLEAFEQG